MPMNGHSEQRDRPGIVDGSDKPRTGHIRDWRDRISDNLAYGLLVYTGLQIFVTMKQLKEITNSMLPYLALVVLVVGIIPAARQLEQHWNQLSDEQAFAPEEAARFHRDRMIIWMVAIGLPFVLAGIAHAINAIIG